MRRLGFLLLVLGLFAPSGDGALAHPHVLIVGSFAPVAGADGKVTALDVRWDFDAAYSAFTAADLKGRKGDARVAELAKLANEVVGNLEEWSYFADIEAGGKRLAVGKAGNGVATLDDGILALGFRLPLKEPLDLAGKTLAVRFYDPTYYIAIEMDPDSAVRLAEPLAGRCSAKVREPARIETQTLSEAAFAAQAEKKGDMRDGIGFSLAQVAEISCK
jgi:ABC-type uncharacterized transport system substrate-binding protein